MRQMKLEVGTHYDREGRWFERGVKEAIYVKAEKNTSLSRKEGLQHLPSAIYNAPL